ncbi:response regulator [Bacillus spizizenii ATCC 6633 = JCM 2499]|uniref:Two-component response regulator (Paired with YhcY) n=1 Tax=Bacillus spizizenii (strain ATCC 23059 / NRRL B-14472 / W23) TaxID=655816 RepID=E0TX12_BACSH|nr:response regulator transcription factor [Bacillus spizizenii]QCJ16260.1 response regulator transcription factor [Bacillus subtilis]ADM36996.1 two-component response regulator (paired with YhcY) [Bacillus spizizenii str. W23]AJW86397.1 LuxR family transcriptional regulator [Bacillus spizizenii]KFK79742.1 bacterial regulatory s, luxR family protein [Bacillus spizizenii]MBE0172257.1 response regulator transcription factor [Bacillus spizizenii]
MKIVIADDHHVVRKGLRFFFATQGDIEVVGEAATGAEALRVIEETKPDLVLMDLSMPEMDGIQAIKKAVQQFSGINIIVLTSYSDQEHVIPALQAGAKAYQLKDTEPEELVKTLRQVHDGQYKLSSAIMPHVLTHMRNQHDPEKEKIYQLTRREKDVLNEIANGKSNKEIAAALFISEKTVKTHVSNLLAKLEVADRTQAALFAVKYNLNGEITK